MNAKMYTHTPRCFLLFQTSALCLVIAYSSMNQHVIYTDTFRHLNKVDFAKECTLCISNIEPKNI